MICPCLGFAKPNLCSLNSERSHVVLGIAVCELGGCCFFSVSLCAHPEGIVMLSLQFEIYFLHILR